MQSKTATERWAGLTVLGVALVIVGAGWFLLRELQIDPFKAISDAGWPYFVILPGVVLLLASLVPDTAARRRVRDRRQHRHDGRGRPALSADDGPLDELGVCLGPCRAGSGGSWHGRLRADLPSA